MSTLSQPRQQPAAMAGFRDRAGGQRATSPASARRPPVVAFPDCPVEAPRARWRMTFGSVVATLLEWRRRSVARRELASFDTRMLRDIGIDPGIVDYELRQSFWRPLRDWRHG
jgi:uncharacterized protein YjiS (DUF1127 family)